MGATLRQAGYGYLVVIGEIDRRIEGRVIEADADLAVERQCFFRLRLGRGGERD